jgi:tRNA U34 5-methylaminomethyl-2-thiouridine-forming methyltransferase MnmC
LGHGDEIMTDDYQLVQLANGEKTLYSAGYGEKLHPGLGPAAEAELLYVRQLQICERLRDTAEQFVIWDVGLGAAANALTALRAVRGLTGRLRLVSFDNTSEPLAFALRHAVELGYVGGFEDQLAVLLRERHVVFDLGALQVDWEFHLGDFPAWLERRPAASAAAHAIFYDAFSPAKNPAMWTLPVFGGLHRTLDSGRPCALTTYSRSTMIRATLLLAGFFVGVGHATGLKEETTIAASHLDLIAEPLSSRWLERAARSDSAEPLRTPVYSRAPLAAETFAKLRQHPQFQMSGAASGLGRRQ